MRSIQTALFACALVGWLPAQNVFHGNGVPGAYFTNTPGVVGQQLTIGFGSPTTPLALALVAFSDGKGPVTVPGFGPIGIDLLSPAYQIYSLGLDPNGDGTGTLLLPPGFPLPTDPPLFAHCGTFELAGLSISKTARIEWAAANRWEAVAPMTAQRQQHTATALGTGPRDNVTEVLICGGATGSIIVPTPIASAELYAPLDRATTPLPSMSLPRAGHRAVRLPDGRVLISGGVTTGGAVTATCELFDPTTLTFSIGPLMSTPRAGHGMTLLQDGRVLITGGISDWTNAAVQFTTRLNTAQDTAELYDPVAGTMTPMPNMAAKRFGHSSTLLPDGRVLLINGLNGGALGTDLSGQTYQVPTWTGSCEAFDPVTLTFAATAPTGLLTPIVERAFHGASVLPNGDVLITGGLAPAAGSPGLPPAVAFVGCGVWDGTSWSAAPSLPTATAFHTQEPFGPGALVVGGITGDLSALLPIAQVVRHDGTGLLSLAPIGTDGGGTPTTTGLHTCTRLYDGTFLIYGGGQWPNTLDQGFVYTPN
ncbi:MAG: Kelch repeat-containing protein [Planctomycetota bacterium]